MRKKAYWSNNDETTEFSIEAAILDAFHSVCAAQFQYITSVFSVCHAVRLVWHSAPAPCRPKPCTFFKILLTTPRNVYVCNTLTFTASSTFTFSEVIRKFNVITRPVLDNVVRRCSEIQTVFETFASWLKVSCVCLSVYVLTGLICVINPNPFMTAAV